MVIQTAYEELGETREDDIHTDLLRHTLKCAGVNADDILALSGHRPARAALDALMTRLHGCRSDAEITGILLGMELVAYENIDLVVDYLGYDDATKRRVADTRWTRMHHALEEEHIRRAVSVFVDHVTTPEQRRAFVRCFTDTMAFWREYWSSIADAVLDAQASTPR